MGQDLLKRGSGEPKFHRFYEGACRPDLSKEGKQIKRLLLFCIFLLAFIQNSYGQSLPDSVQLRILVIRHGEKPDTGLNLDCKGWNRALALPTAIISQFGVPHIIYVPDIKSGKKTKSVRMYQTVIPFAIKYGLPVNSKYDETDSTLITDDLKHQKGLVMVVWDKKNIPSLVRNLGIRDMDLDWNDKDFDSIWIIEFTRNSMGEMSPGLRKGKQGIMPSDICN
jgi:hypothetical protein